MPKNLIEAALFMSSRPMSAEEISKITGVPAQDLHQKLEDLVNEYAGKGIEVVKSPDGWSMRVRPEILPKVAHLTPYSDLRDGHKRTLALVAYKEPVKQSDVVRLQGNKCYAYIKFLIKKGLIKSEKQGRTKILMLTQEFERYFGEEKSRIKEMLETGLKRAGVKEPEEPSVEMPEEKNAEAGEKSEDEKTYSDVDEVIPFSDD